MPLVPPAKRQPYTVEEVAQHNTPASLWVIMNRKVYDVTAFHKRHPGGPNMLLQMGGKDATAAAAAAHKSALPANLMWEYCIGHVVRFKAAPVEAEAKSETVAKQAPVPTKQKSSPSSPMTPSLIAQAKSQKDEDRTPSTRRKDTIRSMAAQAGGSTLVDFAEDFPESESGTSADEGGNASAAAADLDLSDGVGDADGLSLATGASNANVMQSVRKSLSRMFSMGSAELQLAPQRRTSTTRSSTTPAEASVPLTIGLASDSVHHEPEEAPNAAELPPSASSCSWCILAQS